MAFEFKRALAELKFPARIRHRLNDLHFRRKPAYCNVFTGCWEPRVSTELLRTRSCLGWERSTKCLFSTEFLGMGLSEQEYLGKGGVHVPTMRME